LPAFLYPAAPICSLIGLEGKLYEEGFGPISHISFGP